MTLLLSYDNQEFLECSGSKLEHHLILWHFSYVNLYDNQVWSERSGKSHYRKFGDHLIILSFHDHFLRNVVMIIKNGWNAVGCWVTSSYPSFQVAIYRIIFLFVKLILNYKALISLHGFLQISRFKRMKMKFSFN